MTRATALALLLLVAGCADHGDGEGVAGGSGESGGSSAESETARGRGGAIATFDASIDAGFGPGARLDLALVTNPESTRADALDHLQSDDPGARLAAVYALAVTAQPGDRAALAPLLASADPRERVLAAAGLLALGDQRAVPVLIAALGEDVALPFGSPRARVWQIARGALLMATGQDFGLRAASTAAEAAATVPQWTAWWAQAEPGFHVMPQPEGPSP